MRRVTRLFFLDDGKFSSVDELCDTHAGKWPSNESVIHGCREFQGLFWDAAAVEDDEVKRVRSVRVLFLATRWTRNKEGQQKINTESSLDFEIARVSYNNNTMDCMQEP